MKHTIMMRCTLLLALASPALGQSFFGEWEDPPTGPPTLEWYVSPSGNNLNAGTAAAPFRTVTHALAKAKSLLVALPSTINVAPGTYSAPLESFPLTMPAHGIALESWGPGRAIIDGGSASSTIHVDNLGRQVFSSSQIHGLEIRHGGTCILIDGSAGAGQPTRPVAVEIRQCKIHKPARQSAGFGIRISDPVSWESQHIIENNEIGGAYPVLGFGIFGSWGGPSSLLIRSNKIYNWEDNVSLTGPGDSCRPRIFSNFIQLGERNVTLQSCSPHVVNNTIAFAIKYSPPIQRVDGLIFNGPSEVLNLHNNILWNPQPGSGAQFAVDLTVNGGLVAGVNHIEDVTPFLGPGFVGGDIHPGTFTPVDLHLSAASPMIGMGINSAIADLTSTYLELPVGTNIVRRDVNMDIDLDPRALHIPAVEFGGIAVDLGGDEFEETSISLAAAPNQDGLGNLKLAAGTATLNLIGPPNGAYSVYVGWGYFGTVAHPVTGNVLPNTAVYQNLWSTLGNMLLDYVTANTSLLVASGSFNALGNATTTISFGMQPTTFAEAEMYFQMLSLDSSNRLIPSNRVQVEFNE